MPKLDPAALSLILAAAAAPAAGQGLGAAMVAPVPVPAVCAPADLACHRLRLATALRREADLVLRAPAHDPSLRPEDQLARAIRAAEPDAIAALALSDLALTEMLRQALQQAIQS